MKNLLIISAIALLAACDNADSLSQNNYAPEELLGKTVEEYEALQAKQQNPAKPKTQAETTTAELMEKNGFLQLTWENLIAPGYDADAILEKYEPLIEEIPHGSDAAIKLYLKMEEEFNNAPPNASLADKEVSIPGFIAPLEQNNGVITEFLLVPYFGACIHLPPPPANQTVYVKVASDYGIAAEDSYEPIWVSGKLSLNGKSTDIGTASYEINEALISIYN